VGEVVGERHFAVRDLGQVVAGCHVELEKLRGSRLCIWFFCILGEVIGQFISHRGRAPCCATGITRRGLHWG